MILGTIASEAADAVRPLSEMNDPGWTIVPGAEAFTIKLEVRRQTRVENQRHCGKALGRDVSGKAGAVEPTVTIFIETKQSACEGCDLCDVVKAACLRGETLPGEINRVMFDVFCSTEFLKIRDELLRAFAHAGEDGRQRARHAGNELRLVRVDAWRRPTDCRRCGGSRDISTIGRWCSGFYDNGGCFRIGGGNIRFQNQKDCLGAFSGLDFYGLFRA